MENAAVEIVQDFDQIFSMADNFPGGVIWCRTSFFPPDGKNTKANRAVLEFMINNLLIGYYKCRWNPRVQIGWSEDHYVIGVSECRRIE